MVESELGGDLEWACLLRLKSPIEAKAFLLHVAMDGMGTSEDIISVRQTSLRYRWMPILSVVHSYISRPGHPQLYT